MSNAISKPVHNIAANENHQSPAARAAINTMRQNLGRSSAASCYSKLTEQQKAMVLFGARLKPSEHIRTAFDSFSDDHREQIRQSIMALCELSSQFSKISLDRDSFKPVKRKVKLVRSQQDIEEQEKLIAENNHKVALMAAEMDQVIAEFQ